MPSARYLRISANKKAIDSNIKISGLRFYSENTLVDLTDATVTCSFTPASGTPDMVLRSNIVNGEALEIPAALTRGNAYIYIDLKSAKAWDSFQVGFADNDQNSLTKLRIDYSTNATRYTAFESIEYGFKLKFSSPWSFSNLSNRVTSGYPGFIRKFLSNMYYPSGYNARYAHVSEDGHTIFTKKQNVHGIVSSVYDGCLLFYPLSHYLKRGKYYFEISSETGLHTFSENSPYFVICNTNDIGIFNSSQASGIFCLGEPYSGTSSNLNSYAAYDTVIGSYPPDFKIGKTKKGFVAGYTVDTVTGIVKTVNSPYTSDFQFNGSGFVSRVAAAAPLRVFFALAVFGPGNYNANNMDITFNFGHEPFVGPVPAGFDDRIGTRWEIELDPSFIFASDLSFGEEYHNIKTTPLQEHDDSFDNEFFMAPCSDKDVLISPELTHYIRDKVTNKDGTITKKKVLLFFYPQMELLRETTTNSSGEYEFLYLEDRRYAIISQDLFNETYMDEIKAPVVPKKMV